MLTDQLIAPVRLRAPQQNGEILIAPGWDRAEDLVSSSRAAREACDCELHGVGLAEFVQQARRELFAAACDYTRGYAKESVDRIESQDLDSPYFVAGHQPALFHPGVWLKNFAIGRLAEQHDGVAVNLIIDADDVRTASVRVPTGTPAAPRVETAPYDLPLPPQPYEERPIRDRSTFESFGERATQWLAPLIDAPLLSEYWPMVSARSRESREGNLGQSIAQARHLMELAWGNRTLELPQSWLCRLRSVRTVFCHLLANLPRLHETYNAALGGFRERHAIRNHAQPMPNLECEGLWLEAPLWVWSVDRPTRRRLFARSTTGGVELSDRHGWEAALPLAGDDDCAEAVDRLAQWERGGVKIRSRALVTTLVARLVCGDVFVHGIGGARYDEVTDELIDQFFGCRPPPFFVVSGTLHLPIASDATHQNRDVPAWKHRLRNLRYHPEAFFSEISLGSADLRRRAESLASEKVKWIRTAKTPQNARARHKAIERANQGLQAYVSPLVQQALDGLTASRNAARDRQILQSRDYAFCLYPREALQRLLFSF